MSLALRQMRELGFGLWAAEELDRRLRDRILPRMRRRLQRRWTRRGGCKYTGHYKLGKPVMKPYLGIFRKAWWPFETNMCYPLTFHLPDGTRIRPQNKFWSDFGTTPQLLQLIYPKEQFPNSYLFHDSAFDTHTMLIAKPGEDVFVETPVTFAQVNSWLRMGVETEGGTEFKEWSIWGVVTSVGWIKWLT